MRRSTVMHSRATDKRHAPEKQYSAGLVPTFMFAVMATRRLATIVLLCIPAMLLSREIAAAQKPTGQSPPTLIVTPGTSIAFSGPPGGPFSPSLIEYRVSASTGTVSYSIRTPSWLTASSTLGATDTKGVTITVRVNASASSLPPGTYGPGVAFTNVSNGRGSATRPARLIVRGPSLPRPTGQIDRGRGDYLLDARQFSDVAHAGTLADPWPGSAIKAALESLPATGGTVSVADGIWQIDSTLTINVNNFNLVGQSLNAELRFTGAGVMWFGSAGGGTGGISNSTITMLTINAGTLATTDMHAAIRISNAQNCNFNANKILGHQNGGIPAVFFEGGYNNRFYDNTMIANPTSGGETLQLQTLGGTANSDFFISRNTFDSTPLVIIGLDNVQITNNTLHNRTLGNSIGIMVSGPYGGTNRNVVIDGNTMDAGSANGAVIAGLPQDPGGTSNIDGFSITNNIIKGTGCTIAAQSLDPNNYIGDVLVGNGKKNVTITGNQLTSAWTGSVIDIRGGAGTVDTVVVQSNTLQNSAGAVNVIKQDSHTTNVTVANNTGL
jgi:hypothetical protein